MSTDGKEYAARLDRLQNRWWKRWLDVQRPYRWNLKRLELGKTLDIGCGIGRNLANLPLGSIGIDHNEHAVATLRRRGLAGYTQQEFLQSPVSARGSFDTLLFGHVLEHMTRNEGIRLLETYLTFLRPLGRVVILCPQERGFKSDSTHVTFLQFGELRAMLSSIGFRVCSEYSFPLPRIFGRYFRYNEFVTIGTRMVAEPKSH